MTLVETMIVVVIIGILAAIASAGYGRYVGRARLSEAMAMLAEMSSKERVYFTEFAQYLPLRLDYAAPDPNPVNWPRTEVAGAFYPRSPDDAAFDSRRSAATITAFPPMWRAVGMRPQYSALFCTYMSNAGPAGTAPAGNGFAMFGGTTPNTPWFYGLAACNLTGAPGLAANEVMLLGLTSDSPSIRTFNENK